MDGVSALLAQRSVGEVRFSFGKTGVINHRESGCSKIRSPKGSAEAILINTSGGMAGGDQISTEIEARDGAKLAITTQAAERIYRSLGPPAQVSGKLVVGAGAALHWLPLETIQFDGSRFARRITAQVEPDAELLIAESFVLGRTAMGETVSDIEISDHWDIYGGGNLVHAERFHLGPQVPRSMAGLAAAQAFASLLLVSPDADKRSAGVMRALAGSGAVSCWNGKLLARLVAEDGMKLKKALAQAIAAATGGKGVPRIWAL